MKNAHNRLSRFNLGLIISMAFSLVALEWKSYSVIVDVPFGNEEIFEIEDDWMPINFKIEEKPEPIVEKKATPSDQFEVVDNKTEVVEKVEKKKVEITIDPDLLWMEPEPEKKEREILFNAEVNPSFEGGDKALYEYIYKKVKYNAICRDAGVEGMVWAQFVVDENGKATKGKILRGIAGCKFLEEEVLRMIEGMPKWNPGKQKGHPVPVYFTIKVKFELQ